MFEESDYESDETSYSDSDSSYSSEDSEDEIHILPAKKKPQNLEKDWNWKNELNTVKTIPFKKETCGINPEIIKILDSIALKNRVVTEYDVFSQFVDDSFWQLIVNETNNDASDFYKTNNKPTEKWFDCSIDEMKAFFALIILMGQIRKPSINQYWCKRKIIQTSIFNEIMPYSRFILISRFLRFSKRTESQDPKYKLEAIIDMIIKKFKYIYSPEKKLSVDESLVKFKGRFKFKQFIPSKSAKTGIKLFKCCESESGYCLDLHIYTRDFTATDDALIGEQIVFKVAKDYLNKGHVIYMDNWFTSADLLRKLLNQNTYGVGTTKSSRKYFPKDLISDKKNKKKNKLEKGEIQYRSSNNILALIYSDRKLVNFLTSYHKQIQPIKIKKHNEEISRPECIDDYNKNMGGVDKQDQKLASFSLMRKSFKWYKKLFIYLFDVIIQNSSVIFYKYHNLTDLTSKTTYSNYRLNLVESILSKIKLPAYSSKKLISYGNNPFRYNLNDKCALEHIPSTSNKKHPTLRCKYCAVNNLRKETVYRCKHCLIPLHRNCFDKYHDKRFEKVDKQLNKDINMVSD